MGSIAGACAVALTSGHRKVREDSSPLKGPFCETRRCTELKGRPYTYECRCCGRQTSITAGTVMHHTHLPLKFWFWAAHLIANHHEEVSARQLKALLGRTYKAAWLLKQKLQRPMNRELLKGLVEIGRATIPFRGAGNFLDPSGSGKILLAAATTSLEIRIGPIPDDSPTSIEAFVRRHVQLGATLLTDLFPHIIGYRFLVPRHRRKRYWS